MSSCILRNFRKFFFKERKIKKLSSGWIIYIMSLGKTNSVKKLCLVFKDFKKRDKTQKSENPVEKEVNTLNIKSHYLTLGKKVTT